ncbi:MAG: hypothetical protein WEA04_04495 [Candidatus Andersenbacteria bacterium]
MATINLAPGTAYLASIRRRRRALFSLSIGIVVLLVVMWGILAGLQSSAARALTRSQAQLQGLERRIIEAGDDVTRITLFEERIDALEELLATHVSPLPLLQEIERLLPAPTVLIDLEMTTREGQLIVSGNTPNIDEVAQTLASLTTSPTRKTMFTAVDLASIARNETASPDGTVTTINYSFQATLNFPPEALQGSRPNLPPNSL